VSICGLCRCRAIYQRFHLSISREHPYVHISLVKDMTGMLGVLGPLATERHRHSRDDAGRWHVDRC